MFIVTSYKNPDLDGIACSIAYSELLNKLGKMAQATYCGEIGPEVEFVRNFTQNFPTQKHEGSYEIDEKFILVDTADPNAIESSIVPDNVSEIYDHRQVVFTDTFINAIKHIELVGSCATLITEQFLKNNVNPSSYCATYLYSAIVSNTINFKNTVTTERDKNAAKWLCQFTPLPEDYIKKMFASKSHITEGNLQQMIEQDFAMINIAGKKVGISQLEIVDLQITVESLQVKLVEILSYLKVVHSLDYIFFTGIDIFEGYNIFITVDQESTIVFAKALGIPNLQSGYKTNSIIMRKQIVPKLKAVLTTPNI